MGLEQLLSKQAVEFGKEKTDVKRIKAAIKEIMSMHH